ncbi:lamin tail domain-containing protein [Candidatus Peregrinibacteria bacterium]|nr:lamin tail domain-containing protein [Candidatus Peregrinibacteria bacterium]
MYQKKVSRVVMGLLVFSFFVKGLPYVHAAQQGSVVINEVAWSGSADSANDEWIELYNPSTAAVDLTGWTIQDDHGASVYALSGSISSHGYYVIEESEAAIQPLIASLIVNVSLANSGDSLTLIDAQGTVIDDVNSSGGVWFAGDAVTHATMERVSASGSGDVASNWATSTGTGLGNTASAGAGIQGTPGGVNSVSGGVLDPPVGGASVTMSAASSQVSVGNGLDVTVGVANMQDLFAYGFDILYNPQVLTFRSADMGSVLSAGGSVNTSFQAGLENGQAGKLVVAEARTLADKQGVDGGGVLFTLHFDVVGGSGNNNITFGDESFLADTVGDIAVEFPIFEFSIQDIGISPVSGLQAVGGADRFSIQLSWQAAGGADSYKVYRKASTDEWKLLGSSPQLQFLDSDAVMQGGQIIPNHTYQYQVVAVKGALESDPVQVSGIDNRGLKGDNNRSDRLDGRDLERLALHYAEVSTSSGFDPLIDTTYDGQIDGSDLIDIGLSFGKTY